METAFMIGTVKVGNLINPLITTTNGMVKYGPQMPIGIIHINGVKMLTLHHLLVILMVIGLCHNGITNTGTIDHMVTTTLVIIGNLISHLTYHHGQHHLILLLGATLLGVIQ